MYEKPLSTLKKICESILGVSEVECVMLENYAEIISLENRFQDFMDMRIEEKPVMYACTLVSLDFALFNLNNIKNETCMKNLQVLGE